MIIIKTTTRRALGLTPTPLVACSYCHRGIEQADAGWAVWDSAGREIEDVKFVHREGRCYERWRIENEVGVAERVPLDVFLYTLLRTLADPVDFAELAQGYARRGEGASMNDQQA